MSGVTWTKWIELGSGGLMIQWREEPVLGWEGDSLNGDLKEGPRSREQGHGPDETRERLRPPKAMGATGGQRRASYRREK